MNNHEVDLEVKQKSLDDHDRGDKKKDVRFGSDNEVLTQQHGVELMIKSMKYDH